MNFYSLFLNVFSLVLSASTEGKEDKYPSGNNTDQVAALQFLQYFNDQLEKIARNKVLIASGNYNSNRTEADEDVMPEDTSDFKRELWRNATSFAWKDFKDTNKTAYRMFKIISVSSNYGALSKEKLEEMDNVADNMFDVLTKARVCAYNAPPDEICDLDEKELDGIFRSSRNYGELTHFWSEWLDVTGKMMKDQFIRNVELSNEAAASLGFSDMGEMWRDAYESEDFEEDVEELWQTLKPFYEQLHAYVRQKLRKQYTFSGIKTNGPIPAHLLGHMLGGTWGNIFDIVSPYPGKESTDVTKMMKEKNMTVLDMVKMSEEFFTSLGLFEMTPEFWQLSNFVDQPNDTEWNCAASAGGDGKHVKIP